MLAILNRVLTKRSFLGQELLAGFPRSTRNDFHKKRRGSIATKIVLTANESFLVGVVCHSNPTYRPRFNRQVSKYRIKTEYFLNLDIE
jgi:hypothetical protein